MRVGLGMDVHRLVPHRKLILGGIEIPHAFGLLGHSDADVLTHALMDALLGAAGLGDIGKHFPDTDMAYKDVDSIVLLQKVMTMIEEAGYTLGNCDVTIAAQAPKLNPYFERIQARLAGAMGVEEGRINLKATTTEELGPIGAKEGICALCVALLQEKAGSV
ncbi:2-C-methyl-D-erythritol 2,4-cyclodiphosphate synthase [Eubacteriales bacterium OttesenSCG-928-M02]|nr:2-C-methyl-D-erythritol 2,4-cyclodiphosphate synthase [Eubacteriales bacterium OttesenSCG-928-M02]